MTAIFPRITRGIRSKCYYCGAPDKCTKDHFIPRNKGGQHTVWACGVCQGRKKDMLPLVWVDYVQKHPSFTQEAKERIKNAVESLGDSLGLGGIRF